MNVIHLTDNSIPANGLSDMMTVAIGDHGYTFRWVEVDFALLVIKIAKRAEDNPDWFPHGKWATIQRMQAVVEQELDRLFK